MKYQASASNAFIELRYLNQHEVSFLELSGSSELMLVWFKSDENRIRIDNIDHVFNTNDIICLTEFHKVSVDYISDAMMMRWNKSFYCIINHDSEVGCKGILFYGAHHLPVISLDQSDEETFSTVWKMLEQEMRLQDNLQEEMLQMMLKRILILCTRKFKEQTDPSAISSEQSNIIREYHFLVEQHFKSKHSVAEYADLLFKSPKTLSNLFKKLGSKSPLQFIKDRRMLEARRLLKYTDMSVSEVAYNLGFSEVQSFSRFFKKEQGISPVDFRR